MEVLSQAVTTSIEKAKLSGIAIVGASNYSSATGAIGLWSRKIANEGFIGIVMSQVISRFIPIEPFLKLIILYYFYIIYIV